MSVRLKSSGFEQIVRSGLLATLGSLVAAGCVDSPAQGKKFSSGQNSIVRLDPAKAVATVKTNIQSFDGLKGDVPVLNIAFSGADSADVWRCRADFQLVYGNGLQKLSELPKSSPDYPRAAEDAFKRMRGDISACRAIALNTVAQTVTDYAATDGRFYYIVNPCVSESASVTHKFGCSYVLEVTEPITYTNTRTAHEIEVLSGMTTAEGRLYANLIGMRRAADEANESLTVCTWNEAMRLEAQAHLMGVIKLLSGLVLTPLVNGLMAGVGTALNGAINKVLGLAAPQQIQQLECPEAQVKVELYNTLHGRTVGLAQEVLESRVRLSQWDGQYANVENEFLKLKNLVK